MSVPRGRDDLELVSNVDQTPMREAIARRAYELYLQRGREHGNDWQDWLAAEREPNAGATNVAA